MANKTIIAWVNGAVQNIEVPDVEYVAPPVTLEGKASAIIATVTLPAADWEGASSPYSQVITSSIFTANSMVDLQPTPAQLAEWQDDGLAFSTANDDGTVRVYVAGGLPTADIIVQIKVQEVIAI